MSCEDAPHESPPTADPESVEKSSSTPESTPETAGSTDEPALESGGEREGLLSRFNAVRGSDAPKLQDSLGRKC